MMAINVFIDSCAWNYLYENSIDLKHELPSDRFLIHITREVEIEISAIPDVGADGVNKEPLNAYIRMGVDRLAVQTSYVFGFQTYEPDGTPSPVQVYGGFDVGMFQSDAETDFYALAEVSQKLHHGRRTKSGLGRNQADASLAAKSLSSIVLTNERMSKSGPLKVAAGLGGRVVYLEEQVKNSGKTIGEYLESVFNKS